MDARVLLMTRLFLVAALFPALAGCVLNESGTTATHAEPLQHGIIAAGDPPGAVVVPWADAAKAIVRPGIMIQTEKRDCLSNFLFVRPDNGAVFLGTTAYCVRDLPIGSGAIVGDGNDIAILVYSSAQTMAETHEQDPNALEYNDFALFHLDSSTVRKANPELTNSSGPSALADGNASQLGAHVKSFARSQQLPSKTEWRDGVVAGRAGDWALMTYQVLPTLPGSMGGGAIDDSGKAVGVTVTLGVEPNPGANAIARLDTLLAYAHDKAGMPLQLATAS